MMDHDMIRRDFPLIYNADFVYLDSSATSQKPQSVMKAVEDYYRTSNANPLRGLYDLSVRATELYENAREKAARFIGGAADEIVFTRNASESLNLIAYSYALNFLDSGDEIIVAISEHHSDMLPWQFAAKQKGCTVKYLECDEQGRYTAEGLESLITDRTRIVAMAQVSNVIGRENAIKRFAEIAHAHGAVFVCDGAQSVPHMKVDVKELGVDFFVFSGHKMLAPMGIGVLWARHELLEKMPPFLYGGEMIEYVTLQGATYAEVPHKFEAGTVNDGGAVGLAAAIDYIDRIGFDYISQREEQLCALAMERITDIPHIRVIGSDDPHEHHGIITFTVEGVHPHDVSTIMSNDKVCVRAGHHCAQPLHKFLKTMSTTRASIAFYNNEDDIIRFTDCLKTIRRRMGYDE